MNYTLQHLSGVQQTTMSVFLKLCRFSRRCKWNVQGNRNNYSTAVVQSRRFNIFYTSVTSITVGVIAGTVYSWHKIIEARKNTFLEGKTLEIEKLQHKPPVPINRQVVYPVDTTGLKLTLFQYQTCPFCCKVRVFLDYYGISYDVVEVDPVLRREISWSSYKKVPILVANTGDGFQPLNDSSMIVSLLSTYLNDKETTIDNLVTYYPSLGIYDSKGAFKYDILNKYFLMYQNGLPKNVTNDDVVEERKWRKWADDVLVHTLSPNVYRTLDEAFKTFHWFSYVGKWEEYFPTWERMLIINVGSIAMWLIGKQLRKRHGLKEDVRESFYDELNTWTDAVKARGGMFMGGKNPDLSDLAVYGILKSIEGCAAFKDALQNTNIGTWYEAMRERVDSNSGSKLLKR